MGMDIALNELIREIKMAIVKLELNKNIEQSYTVKLTSLNDEAMVQGRLPDPIDLKSSFRTWRESACENISRLKPRKQPVHPT